jgi:PKD repeat protein
MNIRKLLFFVFLFLWQESHAQCTADAGLDSSVCIGASIQLGGIPSATGSGVITYSWSPATGLSCTNCANPTLTITSTQTYTLTITDGLGCTQTDQVNIIALPIPTAGFSITGNNNCSNIPVSFTNTSSGSGLTHSWNFNDPPSGAANTSNAINPLHTFSLTGSGSNMYNVTLVVSDANGCTASSTQAVTILASPGPALMDPITDMKNCDGSNFAMSVYDASATGAVSNYTIQWGDGTPDYNSASAPSPENHTYTTNDIFTMNYIVTGTNGCVDTTSYNVANITNPAIGAANPGATTGCGPLTLCFPLSNFSTNHNTTFYVVDYGDGSPLDTLPHPPPSTICHTYTQSSCGLAGNQYVFSIKAINRCDSSEATVSPIRVYTGPQAHFNPAAINNCVNTPVQFNNTTIAGFNSSCNSSTVYQWNFGDGQTLTTPTLTHPTHTYTAPGTYTVSLTTTNFCGSNTETHDVCIEVPPIPSFNLTPDSACVPFISNITNSSTLLNTCNVTPTWAVIFNGSPCLPGTSGFSFAGGTNASSTNPQIQFTNAGNYIVRLTLTNSCGSYQTQLPIVAQTIPQITLNPLANICANASANPTAVVNDCMEPSDSYAWTFTGGVPTISNSLNPGTITYPSAGTFPISFSATNACGTAIQNTSITVNPIPPTLNPLVNSPICEGDTAHFTSDFIAGVTYNWSGPSGFNSTSQNFDLNTVTSAQAGTYTLSGSIAGCPGPSSSVNLVVNPNPIVSVIPTNPSICQGASVALTASGATSYTWSPATGLSATTGASVTASPTLTQTFVVTGSNGTCSDTAQVLVTVNPLPVVNAGNDTTLCDQPFPVALVASPTGGTWSGTNVTPAGIFTPNGVGSFVLTYTFTDGNGCVNSDQRMVNVIVPTQPNAGPDFAVCHNAANVNLAATPTGGTWSGTNVTPAGVFTPSTVGTFTLVYSYGNGNCLLTDTLIATVNPLPVVDAGLDFARCIDAAAVNLGGTPAGGNWSGPGVAANAFTPATAGLGVHTLTYNYTDINGCSSSDVLLATVNPLPVVNAGNDTTLCDQPFPVALVASPAGGTWSGTNVTPAGIFTPNGLGSFVLTYTFTDGNGCVNSDQRTVTVVSPIQSNAGPDLEACIDAGSIQIAFTPVSGTWTGSGVSTSGLFTPTVAGTFQLILSNGAGNCLTKDTMLFTIHPLPIVNAGADADFCPSDNVVNFSGLPVGGTWSGTGITDVNLGTFSPGTAGVGTHIIVYTYTNPTTGCLNRDTLLATVHPFPTAQFTYNPIVCLGVSETFTNTSIFGNTYQWDFGDGNTSTQTSPSHSYTSIGFFNIELIVTSPFGCLDTIVQQVEVREPPVANFSLAPDSACGPVTVAFTDFSTGPALSYNWNFGNGQSSNVPSPGSQIYNPSIYTDTTYTVLLTLTNFCGTDTHTETIQVMPSPTAVFGTNTNIGCSPLSLDFVNNSYGLPDSYQWDFGDGTNSTQSSATFSHIYTTGLNDTTYNIQLVVTNECGSDTVTHFITVQPNQVNAFFNVDLPSGCVPHTVNFTQFSQGATFSAWDFGDGNGATTYNATHTFTTPGSYTVSLFANDGCGFDTTTAVITVFPSPVVDFSSTPDSVCINEVFTFTNLSSNVSSVSWDFGDGNTSILTNPQHAYAASGTYQVTLSGVSQTNGCVGSITKPVVVSTNPVAAFVPNPTAGCEDLLVQFTNQSTNYNFQSWNFGDGNLSTAVSPSHTYTSAGTYTVKLYVENANGCADSIQQIVTVYPLPVADFNFSINNPCLSPATATFTNASSGAASYEWNFGNTQTSILTNPTTNYSFAGDYQVSLIATSIHGCKDTVVKPLSIYNQAVASFILPNDSLCQGQEATFSSTAQFADSLRWNFGNGTIVTGNPIQYSFTTTGVYPVTLIAYGEGGCNDTVTINTPITIVPSPTADFSYVNVQVPDPVSGTVEFTNESNGHTWSQWFFGNGNTSTEENPIERYEEYGEFDVILVAGNQYGCTDTARATIDVDFFYGLFIPNAMNPGHQDFEVANFIPKGVGLKTFELLIYDDWGNLIWSTTALDANGRPTEYWDGTYMGVVVQQDAYVWKCTASFMNSEVWEGKKYPKGKIKRAGTVTVIH